MSSPGIPAVAACGVSKTFRLPHERVSTLKERALHPLRRPGYEGLKALEDVSFEVEPGEFFGIVGRNGSGKSTLLKCLAGIYRVDRGQIYVNGRLSTFIELGVGFNPDLAARDNVTINGIMLGLSPREARARFDRIIEFAELEDFVDLKLKNYSSGMQVRLAFSVMIQVDADILLIDEVLAVGDVSFQQKCFDVFHRLRDEGKTILFVTHDMSAVKRFCHRALLLDRGEVRLIGDPERVGHHYLELNFGRDRTAEGQAAEAGTHPDERFGSGAAEIVEAWFENERGERAAQLQQGRPMTFRIRLRFNERVEDPAVAFLLETEQRQPLFATSSEDGSVVTGAHAAGEETVFSVTLSNHFAPGRLYATPWMVESGTAAVIDRRPRLASVVVTGMHVTGGMVDLPHEMRYERGAAALPDRAQA